MDFVKGKTYMVKAEKFKEFDEDMEFRLEGTDREVFGGSWGDQQGNPTCLIYAVRSGLGDLPWSGNVFYGKIYGMGHLVHESELYEKEETNAG